MAVLRTLLGEALRTTRLSQERTLREVSSAAQVSLGYLSEVERGQKEASSELLASICRALGVRLSDVLREVSESLSVLEPEPAPVHVPDTLPAGLPALEPVGADGATASAAHVGARRARRRRRLACPASRRSRPAPRELVRRARARGRAPHPLRQRHGAHPHRHPGRRRRLRGARRRARHDDGRARPHRRRGQGHALQPLPHQGRRPGRAGPGARRGAGARVPGRGGGGPARGRPARRDRHRARGRAAAAPPTPWRPPGRCAGWPRRSRRCSHRWPSRARVRPGRWSARAWPPCCAPAARRARPTRSRSSCAGCSAGCSGRWRPSRPGRRRGARGRAAAGRVERRADGQGT